MQHDLVDIGVNLAHRSFHSDRAAVIARAATAGVRTLIVTGTSVKSSLDARELAQQHPGALYSTAGVHPHDARNCDADTISKLCALAAHEEVVAIGECGLDFNRDFSPRPVQEKWFTAQLELAAELSLPLFLHERDAHERFVELLSAHRDRSPAGVVHCFTGTRAQAQRYLDLGLHLGITGWICDERRGKDLQQIVKYIPLDRLMIETDAPFLTPRDLPSKPKDGRNEPCFLPHVAHTTARLHQKPYDEIAAATTATARAFFSL